jgi:DNA-binding NarL/FixJ family response regulator
VRAVIADDTLLVREGITAVLRRAGIEVVGEAVDLRTATRVLAESPERLGYLLKQRVTDVDDFVATLHRVVDGGAALDPEVVSRLLARASEEGRLRALTVREREALQLAAEGRSNRGIADRLAVSERAVQKHLTGVFAKLGLTPGPDDNRRILAVLAYLRAARPPARVGA